MDPRGVQGVLDVYGSVAQVRAQLDQAVAMAVLVEEELRLKVLPELAAVEKMADPELRRTGYQVLGTRNAVQPKWSRVSSGKPPRRRLSTWAAEADRRRNDRWVAEADGTARNFQPGLHAAPVAKVAACCDSQRALH